MENVQLFGAMTGTGTGARLRAAFTLRGLNPAGGFAPTGGVDAPISAPDPDVVSPAAT